MLGAGCLHVVQLHVWAALHQPECGVLEEVGSELVPGILGGQLACADEAATKDLQNTGTQTQSLSFEFKYCLAASLANQPDCGRTTHPKVNHDEHYRTEARRYPSNPTMGTSGSMPRAKLQHLPAGAVQQSTGKRSPRSKGAP